jgi:hypothetical protein
MKRYKVYRKDELRENCNCGFCTNRKGFKNTLKTWHATLQLFTDSLNHALHYVGGDKRFIIFEAQYSSNFEQHSDYNEILTNN